MAVADSPTTIHDVGQLQTASGTQPAQPPASSVRLDVQPDNLAPLLGFRFHKLSQGGRR